MNTPNFNGSESIFRGINPFIPRNADPANVDANNPAYAMSSKNFYSSELLKAGRRTIQTAGNWLVRSATLYKRQAPADRPRLVHSIAPPTTIRQQLLATVCVLGVLGATAQPGLAQEPPKSSRPDVQIPLAVLPAQQAESDDAVDAISRRRRPLQEFLRKLLRAAQNPAIDLAYLEETFDLHFEQIQTQPATDFWMYRGDAQTPIYDGDLFRSRSVVAFNATLNSSFCISGDDLIAMFGKVYRSNPAMYDSPQPIVWSDVDRRNQVRFLDGPTYYFKTPNTETNLFFSVGIRDCVKNFSLKHKFTSGDNK